VGNLYLIRHGQASFGAQDYDVLSPVGVRQSQALGEHLAQLGIRLERCVAGDLRRQQDTARLALQAMQASGNAVPAVETDAAFNEFDADGVIRALLPGLSIDEPNAPEILSNVTHHRSEFQRLFALMVQRWHAGTHGSDELETWEAFTARVREGLNRVLDNAGNGDNIASFRYYPGSGICLELADNQHVAEPIEVQRPRRGIGFFQQSSPCATVEDAGAHHLSVSPACCVPAGT